MTGDQHTGELLDLYLDGGRDVCLALITCFETAGKHLSAELAREALFIVESERSPR